MPRQDVDGARLACRIRPKQRAGIQHGPRHRYPQAAPGVDQKTARTTLKTSGRGDRCSFSADLVPESGHSGKRELFRSDPRSGNQVIDHLPVTQAVNVLESAPPPCARNAKSNPLVTV